MVVYAVYTDAKKFPNHDEIRFAEHQVQLKMQLHIFYQHVRKFGRNSRQLGIEKNRAQQIFKNWNDKHIWITGEHSECFSDSTKQLECDDLILRDVVTYRVIENFTY